MGEAALSKQGECVGRFNMKPELANYMELIRAESGDIPEKRGDDSAGRR
jgi:hypothetical protein